MSTEPTTNVETGFRIELKLTPSKEGEKALKKWPAANFSPDFAVAASGVIRLELAGQMIGSREEKIMAVETRFALKLQEEINFWLPDFLGGFAVNLGRAIQTIHEGGLQSKAGFMDEPSALLFRRQPTGSKIMVGFEANGAGIRVAEVPEAELYREVARTLVDFRTQVLKINSKLAELRDLQEISSAIETISG